MTEISFQNAPWWDAERASRRASGSLSLLPPLVILKAASASGKDLRVCLREHNSGGIVILVFRRGEPTMVFSPGDGRSVGEMLVAAGHLEQAALQQLLEERRANSPVSLLELLTQRTALTREVIQRFLDFQARIRLLEALAWQQGYFEIAEYTGGGETTYQLQLPSWDALQDRARTRAAQLPGLLGRFPAKPAQVFVRRRRGAATPRAGLAKAIVELLKEPLLVPQIISRLLVDDDLVMETLLRMAAAKTVVLYPRMELVPSPKSPAVLGDLLSAQLVAEVIRRFRGGGPEGLVQSLWVMVIGASGDGAAQFVTLLGGEEREVTFQNSQVPLSLLSRSVPVGPNGRLHLLALQPELLSPAALAGVLGRCDAVILLRTSSEMEEEVKLQKLRALAQGAGLKWRPLVVGLDVGVSFRPWRDFPDAVLALPSLFHEDPQILLRRTLEALLAAASARSHEGNR